MGRQGREGGRGSDGRRSVAKEKGEHGAASHKRPAPVPRREDEQRCGREIYFYGPNPIKIMSDRKNNLQENVRIKNVLHVKMILEGIC